MVLLLTSGLWTNISCNHAVIREDLPCVLQQWVQTHQQCKCKKRSTTELMWSPPIGYQDHKNQTWSPKLITISLVTLLSNLAPSSIYCTILIKFVTQAHTPTNNSRKLCLQLRPVRASPLQGLPPRRRISPRYNHFMGGSSPMGRRPPGVHGSAQGARGERTIDPTTHIGEGGGEHKEGGGGMRRQRGERGVRSGMRWGGGAQRARRRAKHAISSCAPPTPSRITARITPRPTSAAPTRTDW